MLEIRFRNLCSAMLLSELADDGHGWFSPNADRWHYDFHLIGTSVFQREERFVLPSEQAVTDATLYESVCRAAST